MTDAQLAVVASLAGVLFGVAGTLLTTFIQQRAENRRTKERVSEERRKEHKELVAALSAADVKTWEMLASLSRMDKTLADQPRGPATDALMSRRTERMLAVNAVTAELAERSAMVRILVPELNDAVAALWDAYEVYPGGDFEKHEKVHSAARRSFEKQAQELLNRR